MVESTMEHDDSKLARAEAERAQQLKTDWEKMLDKELLEIWKEIRQLRAISDSGLKLLQGNISSLEHKIDNLKQKMDQIVADLLVYKPLQASIALGRMQAGLDDEFRSVWTLFDKNKTKKPIPIYMSISTILRHRRVTSNRRITTDDESCFDAFLKEHPNLAEPDVMDIFLEVGVEPNAGAHSSSSQVYSEADCRVYVCEMFPDHEVDYPRVLDLYVDLFYATQSRGK
jgi:hypothetical protein